MRKDRKSERMEKKERVGKNKQGRNKLGRNERHSRDVRKETKRVRKRLIQKVSWKKRIGWKGRKNEVEEGKNDTEEGSLKKAGGKKKA